MLPISLADFIEPSLARSRKQRIEEHISFGQLTVF
jgi:hypothetical protein